MKFRAESPRGEETHAKTPTRRALILAQSRWELRATFSNGEQLLLVLGIPVLLIAVGSWLPGLGISPVNDGIAPMVSACVVACAFTSLAIATAFERRAGALTFLATTPLGRSGLLIGKLVATGLVTCVSIAAVVATAMFVGWRPGTVFVGQLVVIVGALVLACIGCASWAFLAAGVLRAEAVLAVANAVFLGLVFLGGIAVPVSALPQPWSNVVPLLPTGALISALRAPGDLAAIVVLMLWGLVGCALALRLFRWDDRRA